MQRRNFSLSLIASLSVLAACSKQETASPAAPAATPIAPGQALEALAREGKGFTVGALMSANTVYVLFDPQCPHCAHLWQSSIPLQGKVKFTWLPVSLLNAKSLPQGAAIMTAANPAETMNTHERELLANGGGISASASIPPEVEAAIKNNTALLDRLGATSVPFVVGKHQGSGQVVSQAGSMSTQALAQFLGIGP
ncbi:thioredoxin fold domain-containing protein [Hydrogenophaga sp. IBVHS1]|uniref:thioredoxin fold domain-containing protein n=1 Tax=unclassified Hydrogenophaga TaxID=2610897 RepID=UPI000A2D39A3|nr:thioredoxin fold domain-containing protein [Hydrogenophaga sp. IBVHS1]OSZ76170.1 thiol:disulfide interchange protein [Hydrogenophaga sp. IBVHS1]